MNRIDHINYEAWLLDRQEGRLSSQQLLELEEFLLANPGLTKGSEELPKVEKEEVRLSRPDKYALRKELPPVGKLDASTIEDHLIARSEGDLSVSQLADLEAYLRDHPELQRTERLLQLSRITPSGSEFPGKSDLKRNLPPIGMPSKLTLNDLLVARLEGDLSMEQDLALNEVLATEPDAMRSWKVMQLTRIEPEPLCYADKDGLKKGGKVIPITTARALWVTALRVAAVVAVLFMAGMWLLDRGPDPKELAGIDRDQVPEGTIDNKSDGGDGEREPAVTDMTATGPENSGSRVLLADSDMDNGPQKQVEGTGSNTAVMDRVGSLPLVEARRVAPRIVEPIHELVWIPAVEAPPSQELLAGPISGNGDRAVSLSQFLLGKLRKEVLDSEEEESRPLGLNDAVAVVDRGIRKVAGQDAGLALARDDRGGLRNFHLRFGQNLSISAGN